MLGWLGVRPIQHANRLPLCAHTLVPAPQSSHYLSRACASAEREPEGRGGEAGGAAGGVAPLRSEAARRAARRVREMERDEAVSQLMGGPFGCAATLRPLAPYFAPLAPLPPPPPPPQPLAPCRHHVTPVGGLRCRPPPSPLGRPATLLLNRAEKVFELTLTLTTSPADPTPHPLTAP